MKSQNNLWFYLGICSFAIVIGLLIGASQSPILGVFISGILGLLVGIGGSFISKEDSEEKQKVNNLDFNIIGKILLQFSLFLIIGVYLGSDYRANIYKVKSPEFIWTEQTKPQSTYEAFDWLRVNEILGSKGYSKSQIKELYELRISERDSFTKGSILYEVNRPYYKILLDSEPESNSFVNKAIPMF